MSNPRRNGAKVEIVIVVMGPRVVVYFAEEDTKQTVSINNLQDIAASSPTIDIPLDAVVEFQQWNRDSSRNGQIGVIIEKRQVCRGVPGGCPTLRRKANHSGRETGKLSCD